MNIKRLLAFCVFIAVVCTSAIAPVTVANASAPAGWRNLQDFMYSKIR